MSLAMTGRAAAPGSAYKFYFQFQSGALAGPHGIGYDSCCKDGDALLLAEGAVMTAGQDVNSNCSGNNIQNGGAKVEIYYPPYCSDVDRPTITSFPSAAIERDGSGFVVEFDIDENRWLDYVALISLSAVSHSVNMTQRYLILDHTPDANDPESKATIEPPPFLYAPPGAYMLVVVDNTRSASHAKFVYVE